MVASKNLRFAFSTSSSFDSSSDGVTGSTMTTSQSPSVPMDVLRSLP